MTPSEGSAPLAGAPPWSVEHVRRERLPRHPGLLASWYTDVTPAIGRRIQALEALPRLAKGFAYPFPHNYVLFQPALRPDRLVDDDLLALRDVSRPLNDADEDLNEWFCEFAEGFRTKAADLDMALVGWRASRAAGRNLQGVVWAERACAAVRSKLGPSWSLRKALERSSPDILKAFLAIPETLRSIRRVRIFVSPDGVPTALAKLNDLGVLESDRVGAVESAKPGLGSWDGRWPTVQLHPTDDAAWLLKTVATAGFRHELRVGYRLFDRYVGLVLDARQQRSIRSDSRAAAVHR